MLNSKLAKWFAIWLILTLVIILVFQPDSRPEKIDTISFETNEADELYFKNMRQFYYVTDEEANGILDVHRLRSIVESNEFIFPFAIFHNWRQNEAFIRIDTSFNRIYSSANLVYDSLGTSIYVSKFPEPDNISQYIFAKKTFKALRSNYKLGIQMEEREIWFAESASRSMKQSLKDYFKLIGKL